MKETTLILQDTPTELTNDQLMESNESVKYLTCSMISYETSI